ncbi:MAG: hypothetical protein H6747_10310 [Deltaproteobacteria bacterium]|nr:hypothetical protein [Deltaproteobacteria bacterium]
MKISNLASRAVLLAVVATLAAGCGTTTGGGGGVYAGGSDASSDGSTGGGGGGGGSSTGDATKNSATITAKDESGSSTQVKAEKSADKGDAENKILGASNADKMLQLFVTDATGTIVTAFIDTEKHPLPKKGIPVGEPNGEAWVTYAGAGAVLNSKAGGSIDIDVCPTKAGEPVVGAFKGVVLANEAPLGPKQLTLDGPFNLVYWGGAGQVACTPPTTGGGGGGGGSVEMGSLGKPSGASCDANPCDGGSNTSRNCCPYVPCLEPCMTKCVTDAQSCFMGCGFDFECPQGCQAKAVACMGACMTSCNVDATCKGALEKLNTCEAGQEEVCAEASDPDVCTFDKCCSEWKAAF